MARHPRVPDGSRGAQPSALESAPAAPHSRERETHRRSTSRPDHAGARQVDGAQLIRVIYLFSQYPAEAFAVEEVRAVSRQGVDVIPVALRGDPRRLPERLRAWGIETQPAELLSFRQARVWSSLVRFAASHPVALAVQIARLIR